MNAFRSRITVRNDRFTHEIWPRRKSETLNKRDKCGRKRASKTRVYRVRNQQTRDGKEKRRIR